MPRINFTWSLIIGALCDAQAILHMRRERDRMTHSFDHQRRSLIDAIDGIPFMRCIAVRFLQICNGNRDSSAHSHPAHRKTKTE